MTYIGLVFKSSLRNKIRYVLTCLGIATSLVLFGVMGTFWNVLYSSTATSQSTARLITHHKVSLNFLLPASYRQEIRKVKGVTHVVPWGFFGGQYKDDAPENFFPRFETDSQEIFDVFSDWKIPPDQLEAWKHDPSGAVVTAGLAKRFGWKVGDHITIKGTIYPVNLDLTIRGIFDPGDFPQCLLFNWSYVQQALPWAQSFSHTYYMSLDSPDSVAKTAAYIDEEFRNSSAPTRTETQKAFQISFLSMLGNVKAFILDIACAVLFAIILISANTMAMSTRERIREFAILRMLGFTKRRIFALLVGEGVGMALLGGFCGLGVAEAIVSLIKSSPQGSVMLSRAAITPAIMMMDIGVAIVVGIISSAIPVYGALRRTIGDGLRHVG
jgi:putative ABC transport system permease protein